MPPELHAVLGASSAKRWLTCTPSARLSERLDARFPKSESEYAKEGTKAHALSEIKIRYALYKADGMTSEKHGRMTEEEKRLYPGINKFRYEALRSELGDIPEDMEEATDSYRDVVIGKYKAAKEYDSSTQLLLEQRLDYSKWVPSGFGTGDCVIVNNTILEICDYKHGKGIPVDAVGNPQIRLYALGALERFGALFDFKNVRGTIIQPRLDSVTEEMLTREELLRWAEEEVVEKAKLAWEGKGDFAVGDHCRFCSAKAVCCARVAEGLKLFQSGMAAAGTLSDEQITDLLAVLDTAEAWIKDLREYTTAQAIGGQIYRGWKLVHGKKPNRAWSDPEEVKAQLLRAGYGPEQFEKTTLRPVGEIEKAIGRKAFTALLGSLVNQGEGKLVLVPEGDKRIEYSSADADFGDLFK